MTEHGPGWGGHSRAFSTFKIGDPVHWNAGTDIQAGTVVRLTKTKIFVREVKAKLLNGTSSGEPDALHFAPGGFVGHTSGEQRWAFGEMRGGERAFSRRARTAYGGGFGGYIAKMQGTPMRGSMRAWGILRHGHATHYDFNF